MRHRASAARAGVRPGRRGRREARARRRSTRSRAADVVLVAPSNPVVSIGTILGVAGHPRGGRRRPGAVVGVSPIIGGAPGARHGRRVPARHRRRGQRRGRRPALRRAADGRPARRLAGARRATRPTVPGVEVRAVPLLMTDDAATAAMVARGAGARRCMTADHAGAAPGDPAGPRHRRGAARRRPRGADRRAAPRLRDGDVARRHLEGRLQGRGPAARPRLRRPGEPRGGAAGGDRRRDRAGRRAPRRRCASCRPGTGWCWPPPASTRRTSPADELALLPVDPDASAAAAARGAARAAGVRRRRDHQRHDGPAVARRADRRRDRRRRHRPRVTDPRGAVDAYGNMLGVTRVAVADEIAAAADLVKGKLGGVPVAIVRGLAPDGKLPDDGRGSRALDPRAGGTTCSGSAPPRRSSVGRADAGAGRGDRAAAARRRRRRRDHAMPERRPGRARGARGLPRLPRRPSGRDVALVRARPPDRERAGRSTRRAARAADPAPARRHVGAGRRALRAGRPHAARRRRPRGARGERHRLAVVRPDPARPGRAPDHLLARRADPALRRAVPRRRPAGAEPVRSDESLDLRWFSWDALPPGIGARAARRSSRRARRRLRR